MKTVWKRATVFFFIFAVFSVLQTVHAETVSTPSGDLSMKQPTKSEIAEQWLSLEQPTDMYITEPSYTAPYVLGGLTEGYLEDTEEHLDFLRYIAHLPETEQDTSLNESAQYASVVTAANGYLSHYPPQPANMEYDFWYNGYVGASSSNLASSWGENVLWDSMQLYMDDPGASNADKMGHRRWLLNPSLYYVGFGQAGRYSATKVFDHSRSSVEYDYIAWPASGNFPSTCFGGDVAWSVCLNSMKYDIPDDSNVKVTLTRCADGKVWVFDQLVSGTESYEYFTIDHTRYGDSMDCIIFRPDLGATKKYEGEYSVSITGITDWTGTPTTLEYDVNFFDLAAYAPALEIIKQPENVCGFPGEVTIKMEASGHHLKYTWVVFDFDTYSYKEYPTNTPTFTYTLDEKSNRQQIYCEISDYSGAYRVSRTVSMRLAEITEQPKTVTVKNGAAAKVSVKATGDGLKYAWYYKDAGAKKYTKSSVKSSAYSTTMDSSRNGRRLYCVVTDKYGNKVQTKTVLLRMAASITTQPTNAAAASGKVAKTKVSAVGDGLKYTWYFKDKGASKFSKSSVTGSTYSMKMSSKNNGRQVYCVVKDEYGKTAASKTVTFGLPVNVTTQPKTAYVRSGSVAEVAVKASGDGLTYTWYVKSKGETKYTKSSITKSTYSVTMSSKTKDRLVYCVVKDKYGCKVQTKTVALRMAASITTQPKSVTAAKGKAAKVTVKAAGDGLTYTWYVKNAGATKFSKSSVTKPTYSVAMSSKVKGRQVYCVVKDKYGKTVKTNTVTLKMR